MNVILSAIEADFKSDRWRRTDEEKARLGGKFIAKTGETILYVRYRQGPAGLVFVIANIALEQPGQGLLPNIYSLIKRVAPPEITHLEVECASQRLSARLVRDGFACDGKHSNTFIKEIRLLDSENRRSQSDL